MATKSNAARPKVALESLVGLCGQFEHASLKKICNCRITGIDRHPLQDLYIIDYILPDGRKIKGAYMRPEQFIADEANR